ncbi:MAG TPA: chemotaxis protein CheW [bacterium]|nr:chemotaxis protein CheW [bacterium]
MRLEYTNEDFIFLFDFITEASEHLLGIEDNILKLETEPSQSLIEAIYRPMHSIKGMSGFVNLNNIKHLTHETENLIDLLKNDKKIAISSELIDLLIKVVDRVVKIIKQVNQQAELLRNQKLDSYVIDVPDVDYNDLLEEIEKLKKSDATDKAKKVAVVKPATLVGPSVEQKAKLVIPEKLKNEFIEETYEHLEIIDAELLKLEEDLDDENAITVIMRELHTIKGGSQIIISSIETDILQNPLNYIQKITHCSETLLQQIVKADKKVDADIVDILFAVSDVLKELIANLKNDEAVSEVPVNILVKLYNFTGEKPDDKFIESVQAEQKITAEDFAFFNTALQNLRGLLPVCAELITNPDNRKNSLKKILRALKTCLKAGEYHNKKSFIEFCNNQITFFNFLKDNPEQVNDAFIQSTIDDINQKLVELEKEYAEKYAKTAQIEEPQAGAAAAVSGPSVAAADKTAAEADMSLSVIKVPMERIDKLMGIIGELIVSKGTLQILAKEIAVKYNMIQLSRRTKEIADLFNRLSDELQNTVMNIRMMPVKNVFNRFPRLVRDIAKKNDKKVKLVMRGEDTELDKTVIEKINDPLLHMIRNSVDHGIETPAERRKAGKSEEGTIILSAWNQGNNVYIELQDDGRGIDEEAVKNKALEKGLVTETKLEKMSKKDILNFIFMPGFSTAKKVTEVSGRGVGMDVVKTNIISIAGTIEIDSEKNFGTKILLILPLTLAVSKGLEVRCGDSYFMIPLENVLETVKINKTLIREYKLKELFNYRDEIVPIVDICRVFGMCSIKKNEEISLVIVQYNNIKFALKVDEFLGETEIVVKPLPQMLENLPGVSGTTIMPDGRVELIINISDLI